MNKCTGYFNYYYNFAPRLPEECSKPIEQDLTGLNKNCRDYINALQSCALPNTADLRVTLDKQCTDYLISTFSYSSCVVRYQSEQDFLRNDWYVYFNRATDFLNDSHDEIKLLDKNGNLIDSFSY